MSGPASLSQMAWMKWRWDFGGGPVFRGCSHAAKGLYMDLMSLMRHGDSYGFLVFKGKRPTPSWMTRTLGLPVIEITKLIKELTDAGVLERAPETEILFSPQMRDDEAAFQTSSEHGRRGGGNPVLRKPVQRRQRAKKVARKGVAPTMAPGVLTDELPLTNQGLTPPIKGGIKGGIYPDLDLELDKEEGSPSEIPVDPTQAVVSTGVSNVVAHPTVVRTGKVQAEAILMWNAVAKRHGLPVCMSMTPDRTKKLALRLKEAGGIAGWEHALGQVEISRFLKGENGSGWRATIDFLLQPSSFAKLMEGAYAHMGNAGIPSRTGFLGNAWNEELNPREYRA